MSSKRLIWRIVRRWYLILKAVMPPTFAVVEYVDKIYSFYRTEVIIWNPVIYGFYQAMYLTCYFD
jgi:hypothetical protein